MKFLILVVFAVIALVNCRPADVPYTTKYDNINIDEVLQSDRLTLNYVNCLLGKQTCTPDGAEIKKYLPEALHNSCANCNENQKIRTRKIVTYLIENKRDWWNLLEAKYDAEGIYRKKYEKDLKTVNY